ncbi:MAG TPA: class I adenylate-forming enzyme family protein, partial [Holophaga sp.]|nr:class I adenylate-forming enzyme family protein [Holophaga sp.]
MSITRIYEWAHRTPTETAVVWNGRKVSYARFAHGIEAARKAFLPLGLPAGSTAVIFAKSLLEAWRASLALRLLGVDTTAVASLETARDLGLRNVSAVLVSEDLMEKSRLPVNPWPQAKWIRIPADSFQAGGLEEPPPLPAEDAPQGGHMLYTSGTTGAYKKLLLSGDLNARRDACPVESDDLEYNATWQTAFLGMWTYAGFVIPSIVWNTGGCSVIDQRVDWADHYFDQDITYAVALPHMLEALLDPTRAAPARKCRELLVGGGFISPTMARKTLERLTDHLLIAYGASELFVRPLASRYAEPDDLHWLAPVMDRIVEIVDDEDLPCPRGTEGHLRVALDPMDCQAYLDDPETTA